MIRRQTNKPVAGEISNFTQINPNAAGIDIGSAEHWVCVPPERTPQNVRKFGCFTPDLIEMASWLLECQVDTIAMESTGVYWIPMVYYPVPFALTIKFASSAVTFATAIT